MLLLFLKGGPVMWPLLATSLITCTVVIERLFFLLRERLRCNPAAVSSMLAAVENGRMADALRIGAASGDFVARALLPALRQMPGSPTQALLRGASHELRRFNRGLSVLDTAITLAPLLGLLGTVTGMIRAFSLLGGQELGAPAAITGGIAEALIATAFGLLIAIVALIPFNFLNAQLEDARHRLEDSASQVDSLLARRHSSGE